MSRLKGGLQEYVQNNLYQIFTLEIDFCFQRFMEHIVPLDVIEHCLSMSKNNLSILALCLRKNQSTEIRSLMYFDFTVVSS